MRQRENHHIVTGQVLRCGLEDYAIAQGGEVLMVAEQSAAGCGTGGQRADLELWVPQQEPEGFPAGIARGPGYRYRKRHGMTMPVME